MTKRNGLVLPVAMLFFFASVVGAVSLSNKVNAQELLQENQDQTQDQAEEPEQNTEEAQNDEGQAASEENQEEQTAATYNYVAQPGDSYTLMARKAVQTYGINNEVVLSEAQIIFTETNLTLAADSPRLNVGQEVRVEESLVKEWVEKAQELSEEDQAAWAAYTAGVDFNTNSVGEAA